MKKIMNKIVLIAVSASMITAILIGIPLSIFINDTFESNLKNNSKQLNDNFDKIVKSEVETAISLLTKINSMTESGELEFTKAQELAKTLLRELRYDKEGYFWADSYDGTNVVLLGKKNVEGTNRLELKDDKNNSFMKEIIKNGRQPSGGFTNYWFPKKGTTVPLPKRSYSKSFEPYQWVIGTGNYVDDIEKIINKEAEEISEQKSAIIFKTVLILLFVIIITSVISIYIGRRIAKPVTIVTEAANALAKGEKVNDIVINSKDETKYLSIAFNSMKSKIQILIDETSELTHATAKGHLAHRANTENLDGSYREIIVGINSALDNLISPLNVSAEYVDRISKGDIPPKITENYQGDFNSIKNNLNQCIDAINLLISDSNNIYQAVKIGNLATKADKDKHQGDFRKVMDGIMNTLEIIGDVFTENILVMSEMEKGNLSVRFAGNLLGEYATLQSAINETLEKLPFKETKQVMSQIANGDLTVKITGDYRGESKELKEAINQTIDSLNDIMSNVRNTVDEVTRGAMQVSEASTALSQGATEQAASLEEITSSMGEIGSQTRHNAENSNMANALSVEARDSAEKGYKEMMLLNDAMNEISESSKNISKIIKVIDEIAFQTNLLALNAAVEAARAGRHGKGFAVVAEEVRNLAARSATAAKETAELIENSIKTVERGTELTVKTGDALEEIKNSSVKVADIIGEITTSSNEQAQGISQINEGLMQIDKVTQTNTASAEQSASAAEELSGQAGMLRELVTRFKLADGGSLSMSYSKPRMSGRSNNQRALPSARRQTSSQGISEDDLMDIVEESIAADNKRNAKHNPKDIINLEDDDFGRY